MGIDYVRLEVILIRFNKLPRTGFVSLAA